MKRARKLCKLVWSLSHKSGKNDNAVFSGSDHQFLFLYPYEAAKQSHISYIYCFLIMKISQMQKMLFSYLIFMLEI